MAGLAQAHGVALQDLLAANPHILHPDLVNPGQVLHLPEAAPAPPGTGGVGGAPQGVEADGGLHLSPGNERYADFITEASSRTGEAPSAIAATIGAEANLVHGAWDPNSRATGSSGLGLTQFTNQSWLGVANESGSALHQAAHDQGLLDPRTGHVAASGRQQVLALRTDPRLSILSAAEYSRDNLNALRASGHIPLTTSPGLTAKVAYLAHHEGLAGARAYLDNTAVTTTRSTAAQTATRNLEAQHLSPHEHARLLSEAGWKSCEGLS